ncbi:hypothetical protein EX895_001582 [Sporisorium graminicola]|uniref:Wings apart-like protein C-terminal domain-containing protein n=1 Tax=Sporisorium graminicola TaxID=280036 RepID=A0A4U7KWG9_9BASI|nr:hypothetical protein EX895_001582 [Sporisorium graminicola]TKY89051.1 hypothetical protein EX895_001582 [Sporisorium graminicola]
MDLPSTSRRKPGTVTYAKRDRTPANSAQSSPATAGSSFAAAAAPATNSASASSASYGDEAGPSDVLSGRKHALFAATSPSRAPSSPTPRPSNVSPKNRIEHASTSPTAQAPSSSRAALISRSASSITPGLFPKPGCSSSSSKLNSTKSLPHRPPRAASPTPSKSSRSPTKRSASTSPRKLTSSIPPNKRLAFARTPSRPPQDLASLFDAIEPTLPQPRSPFARSESSPTVQLHQQRDNDEVSLTTAPVFAPSPLQSPTLPTIGFDDIGELPSPDASTSPSKRPRMADRMAPRSIRPTKSKVDEITDVLTHSRRGSLRRIETAPSLISDTSPVAPFPSDPVRPASLRAKEDESRSARQSEADSVLLDVASQTDSQSQEGANSSSGARRLAGMKQSSAGNAKRTYGLQRSFLADQVDDHLLSASAGPNVKPSNIEDEIEAELKGNGTTLNKPSELKTPAGNLVPDPASTAPRESYAELLRKWGEGADDIEWDESQDPSLNLKSITSLRSQGELRRFNDDLEYLFSGLDASQALSIRQSSAVELVNALCGKPDTGGLGDDDATSEADEDNDDVEDPLASAQSADFLRKLKASDLIARLFDLFTGAQAGEGVDSILDAAFTIYLAKLLRSASSAEPLARERWLQLYTTLRDLLMRSDRVNRHDRKDGFALLRLHNLKVLKIASKSERRNLAELRDVARISKLFLAGSKSWTLRNLVLAACCSLVDLPRRLLTEAAIRDLLVDARSPEDRSQASPLFQTVLSVLVSDGVKASQRLVDFAKGLELLAPAAVEIIPDLDTVDLCIRFLDRGMDILYLELDQAVPASNEILDALQHLASFAIQAAPLGLGTEDSRAVRDRRTGRRALQVLHGIFKTLLDLSQVDANWSESLASSQSLQLSVMRAFSLSYRSASSVRQATSQSDGFRRKNGNAVSDETRKLDAALFDDVVHLSLALLTNLLIKQLDKARDTLQQLRLDPTCWRRRACTTSCTCDTSLPALQLLARVFFETRIAAASHDDSHAAYLSNSIATAIAQFAMGGSARLDTCRAALDAELPSSKSKAGVLAVIKEDGFTTLLDAVEEFAVVHEAALHAERARAAHSIDAGMDIATKQIAGAEAVLEPVDGQGDSNPTSVAAEAGQLIKDLASSLRQMI